MKHVLSLLAGLVALAFSSCDHMPLKIEHADVTHPILSDSSHITETPPEPAH